MRDLICDINYCAKLWYCERNEEIAVSTVCNINFFLDNFYIKIRVKRVSDDLYICRFSSFRYRLYHLLHFCHILN